MRIARTMFRPRIPISLSTAVAALALAALSAAALRAEAVIQFSLRDIFNDDVIVNGTPGNFDEEMGTIEGEWGFQTNSAGAASACTENLPDDALFSAFANRPEVRLGWDQADDGLNAWVSENESESAQFSVPHFHYDAIDLFAVGAWTPELEVTLNYDTGPSVVYAGIRYPSWFDESFGSAFYDVIDGRDRAIVSENLYACDNVDDPAIVARTFPADPSRKLVSIGLERTDKGIGNWLTVLGAVGSLARTVTNYDLSVVFNADVIANTIGKCALDGTYETVDGFWIPATASAAGCLDDDDPLLGLPDDGVFPAAAVHPQFDLGFSDADSGNNARRSTASDTFTIDVPNGQIDELHLFAMANFSTSISVELQYTSGDPVVVPATVPDWLTQSAYENVYLLARDLDGFRFEEKWIYYPGLDAALLGVRIPVDRRRTLDKFKVDRQDPLGPEGDDPPILAIVGASGVVNSGLLFYDGFEWDDLKNWSNL